ncbi:MAG: thioredoxin [Burkholderiaceae bacterium]
MSKDTSIQTFQADVIEASMQVPVLVDFWAEWCGPCKQLGPILDKLEQDYAGQFQLVKVDTEANQELAAHFQIRSIPAVFAFVNGKPVDQFLGVLPEGKIREFIDKLLPDPTGVEFQQAVQALQQGDHPSALEHAKRTVAIDPSHDQARLLIAQLSMAEEDYHAAQGQMDALTGAAKADPKVQELAAQITLALEQAQVPPPPELLERVQKNPADLPARIDLANHFVEHKMWEPALEQLLEVVKTDREYEDDLGRHRMIEVFKLASDQPKLVSEWRRKLGATLNVV